MQGLSSRSGSRRPDASRPDPHSLPAHAYAPHETSPLLLVTQDWERFPALHASKKSTFQWSHTSILGRKQCLRLGSFLLFSTIRVSITFSYESLCPNLRLLPQDKFLEELLLQRVLVIFKVLDT